MGPIKPSTLLGHWLPLAARVCVEPNDMPIAEAARPARRLRQPDGALSATTAVHAPSHVPAIAVTVHIAIRTAHAGAWGICLAAQATPLNWSTPCAA